MSITRFVDVETLKETLHVKAKITNSTHTIEVEFPVEGRNNVTFDLSRMGDLVCIYHASKDCLDKEDLEHSFHTLVSFLEELPVYRLRHITGEPIYYRMYDSLFPDLLLS